MELTAIMVFKGSQLTFKLIRNHFIPNRYMLGGMPGGMTMTKDPNDPFNMKTLKSIPNIANVPSLTSSFSTDSHAFPSAPKPNQVNYGHNKFKTNNMRPRYPNQPPKINPYGGHGVKGSTGYKPNNFDYANKPNGNNNYGASTLNANTFNDDGFSPIINPYMNQNDNFNPLAWRQDHTKFSFDNSPPPPPKRPTPESQLYLRTYRRVPNNQNSKTGGPKQSREPETSLRPPPPMFRKKFISKES